MYAKARIGLLALVALFVLLPSAGKSQSRQRMAVPEDMERWIKTTFAKGHVPPFSFVYDGKPSAQFIRKWKYSASKGASDEAGTIKYLFTYTDPVTGLKVACRVTGFEEFGAVEWMLYFTNTSQRNSAMLTDVKVTDFGMEAGKDASFTLHHAVGSNGGRDDFWPLSTPVEANKSVYITPEGGRSSDHTGFPFMNLEASNGPGRDRRRRLDRQLVRRRIAADARHRDAGLGHEEHEPLPAAGRDDPHAARMHAVLAGRRPHGRP